MSPSQGNSTMEFLSPNITGFGTINQLNETRLWESERRIVTDRELNLDTTMNHTQRVFRSIDDPV